MLAGPPATRRLQKYLLKAIFAPGVDFPPGFDPDPGTVFPPGTEIPSVLPPGAPMPEPAIPPPDWNFPPGWTPYVPIDWGLLFPPGPVTQPGKSSPPAAETWVLRTDDDSWKDDLSYPNRVAWVDPPGAWIMAGGTCQIEPIGTWADGYRPIKFRLAFADGATIGVSLRGAAGDQVIAEDNNYVSGVELDCTYPMASDIDQLTIIGPCGFGLISFVEE